MLRRTTILTVLCLLVSLLVRAQPTPDFTASPVAGCSPLVVMFTDKSTGNPSSWHWDFGNGATSALKDPSTTYFAPGNYTVSLTVTNAAGSNTVTRSQYVTVYGNPSVSFKVSDSVGCYPFPVRFTDMTAASPGTNNTNWLWDFGDGSQSTQQNPQNTYSNTGNYTISLKVTNDKGCWSIANKPNYIKIDGGVAADFDFVQPVSCHTPFNISFTNRTTGSGLLNYVWDFGDGSTSTQTNPTHTYAAPGMYSVMLIAKSSNGCVDTMKKENLLSLQNTVTAFTAPDSICANDNVSFLNTSSSAATTTSWNFGDGTTSNNNSPIKAFTNAGTYTVKLVQTYGICADSVSKNIRVFPRPKAGFAADKTFSCQTPFTVNFQSTSANAVSYQWNFGDGATSTQANPSHTYTTFGNFDVTLIVINPSGCSDTLLMPAYIKLTKPQIQFTSLPDKGCIPYSVTFHAAVTSPEPITSYLWNFGDGTTSTAVSPSYTYNTQGAYTVSLTVTTVSGCTETYTLPSAVIVGRKPVANFSAVPTTACAFQPVHFTNLTNEATSWQWIFGDGGTSGEANPIYAYGDTGTFTVQLIADNNGCKDSFRIPRYVTIKAPIAKFAYQTTCTNKLFYAFKDSSLGATSWFWDFGDGITSTKQNPTHTFSSYGTYSVKLTVSNDTCQHQQTKIIKIVNGTPGFVTSPPSVCKGSTISFIADSTNAENIVSYQWNFGNGSPPVPGMTASTTYPNAGLYSVTLTVTDINGCIDSTVKQNFVRIAGPTAGFTALNNSGCQGAEATFNDASKDDGVNIIKTWQWNLGDGTIVNNTSPAAVKHFYNTPGTYTVSLNVTDAFGCSDTMSVPSIANTSVIKADFVSEDTISCPGAAIQFTNKSTASGNYTSIWNFGDGKTSLQQNPATSYQSDGGYSVQLKIADAFGCADSIKKLNYISIKHPVASYTVSDSASSCIPFQVQFTNTSTYYTQYIWDLNGGTSSIANPMQIYNSPGTYKTKLIVTSPGGCTDTATKTISLYDISASKISYRTLNDCKPLTVELTATSPINTSYIWDFGDGTIVTTNDTTLQHVYNSFGDFIPKVIMKNPGGCVIPVTGLDTLHIAGATAKFGLDNQLFCDSGLVRFTDSTTFNNPILSYNWNFGDGSTSSATAPSHFFSQPGLYNVSLHVQTTNLCVDTFRLANPIKIVASPDVRIGGDSVICIGDGANHMGVFNRPDTSVVKWSWQFPNGNSSSVQFPQRQYYKQLGNFVVQATAINRSGCRDTAYKNISVNPLPSVTLPSSLTAMAGTPVLLPAVYSSGVASYSWTVPDGLSCTTCPQPMAAPKFNTTYRVQFVDSNGCKNVGNVQVIVLCNNANVFVPNTFSPNGDGSNDVFYVRGRGLNRVKTLRIFNRWGQVVFERNNFPVNDPSVGWDGTYKGNKPIPDVYVYQVEVFCDNSNVIKFEGNVALIQ